MEDKKQVIRPRLNGETVIKLEEVADRYGMPVNGLVSFIIGQWLDKNYNVPNHSEGGSES